MKKKLLAMLLSATVILCVGCKKQEKAHWSHEACVEQIAKDKGLEEYVYSVKEIETDYQSGNDEVHCFKITMKSGSYEKTFMCFAVVDDGEVMFVDCDVWRNR